MVEQLICSLNLFNMLETKQIGNLTELQCITAFYELGYKVSLPYGENSRYDFIADINGKLIRVQVKTCKSSEDGSVISFPCRSSRVNSKGCYQRQYSRDEIDYFCTYYNHMCYMVPIDECSKEKKLRFSKPKNNQNGRINYAKEYELLSQVQKIIGK